MRQFIRSCGMSRGDYFIGTALLVSKWYHRFLWGVRRWGPVAWYDHRLCLSHSGLAPSGGPKPAWRYGCTVFALTTRWLSHMRSHFFTSCCMQVKVSAGNSSAPLSQLLSMREQCTALIQAYSLKVWTERQLDTRNQYPSHCIIL